MSEEQNKMIERAIASVLANYAYSDFKVISDKQLSIGEGENKYFYWGSMSTPDTHIWRTENDDKIMVALRGTSTIGHVIRTWPIIGASLERIENNYLPYFDFFTNQTKHIRSMLKTIGIDNYENLTFIGHSMAGVSARVNQEKFPNSKAYTFNQGSGLLTNPYINKLTQKFIKSHIGQLVEIAATSVLVNYVIPTGIISPTSGDSIVSLTKDWAKQVIRNYMKTSNFNGNNRTEHHRTQYDVVSLLGSYNKNTFMYPAKGKFYDILNNHDMDHLMHSVLNSTNMTSRIFVKDLTEETVKNVVKEVANDIAGQVYMLTQAPNYHIDILGRKNIYNTGSMVAESRANWMRNIANPFLFYF